MLNSVLSPTCSDASQVHPFSFMTIADYNCGMSDDSLTNSCTPCASNSHLECEFPSTTSSTAPTQFVLKYIVSSASNSPSPHLTLSCCAATKPTTCRDEVTQKQPHYPSLYQALADDRQRPSCSTDDSINEVESPGSDREETSSNVSFVSVDSFVDVVKRLNREEEDEDEDDDQLGHFNIALLDCRENRLYQNSHLKHSISASCHSKVMAKRSIASWISMCRPKSHCNPSTKYHVYIYDQKTDNELMGSLNSNLQIFVDYLLRKGNRVFILNGGFDRFKSETNGQSEDLLESCLQKEVLERYTFSPTNKESASEDVLNAGLSKITDNIWIGNERCAHDWDLLSNNHITHVLNVTNDVPNYYENKRRLTYYRLCASDNQMQDLYVFFDEAFKFIDQALKDNGRILVHCWAGVSRSPTIVLAYLMHSHGWCVATAMDFVRKQRPIIAPNFNFLGQLERFYNTCLKQRNLSGESSDSSEEPPHELMKVRTALSGDERKPPQTAVPQILRPLPELLPSSSTPSSSDNKLKTSSPSQTLVAKCHLRRGVSGVSLELPPPGFVADPVGSVAITSSSEPRFTFPV